MSANTDNYIVVNHTTGEIICTGRDDDLSDNRPIIYQDEANNTIMILTLQEGETFSGIEDTEHYFDVKTYQTLPKKEIELVTSHPFVEPFIISANTDPYWHEDDEPTLVFQNRINVPVGTKVTLSNIPSEIKSVTIIDGHAEKEYTQEVNGFIAITRDYEELTKIVLSSPKHNQKIISLRFIAEDSLYDISKPRLEK